MNTEQLSSPLRAVGYKFGALAFHLQDSVYEVCCCNCCAVIGTMQREVLVSAIFRNQGRGGVLCPECREKACDGCGLVFDHVREGLKEKWYRGVKYRLCEQCNL